MKRKIKLLIFGFLLVVTTSSFSQSMSDFFKYEGVAALASMAHPTNTYKSGRFQVYTDYVLVNIYYEKVTTKLKIYRSGDVFTRIIVEDEDWWPAFSAIQLLKDLIIEASKEDEDSQRGLTEFERNIGKTLKNMTGQEMACALLTIGWFAY